MRLIQAAIALQMTCLQRMAGAPQQLRVWQISKTETLVRVQAKAAPKFYHLFVTCTSNTTLHLKKYVTTACASPARTPALHVHSMHSGLCAPCLEAA